MITAVDTSVLTDIFLSDPKFLSASSKAVRQAWEEGAIVVCEVVWAELFSIVRSVDLMDQLCDDLGLRYSPMNQAAAELAGMKWHEYRKNKGPRDRVMADFLVGAHAQIQCDRLLTRDHGFGRMYFTELEVIVPAVADR